MDLLNSSNSSKPIRVRSNVQSYYLSGRDVIARIIAQDRARMCQNLYSSYGSTETSTVAFGPSSVLEKVPGASDMSSLAQLLKP